jgi:predicted alpha/beta hydrolase family esterase
VPECAAPLRLAALNVPYGEHPLQFANVRDAPGPLVLLLHGGVWKAQYDLAYFEPLAEALGAAGYATANVEYRRVGNGGGWPQTLEDVLAAVERFRPAALVGHSAGGHLALLAGKRTGTPVVGAAAICDPATWDNPGVEPFFGGSPPADASPLRQAPLGIPVVLVHGTRDDVVPLEQSERLAAATGAPLVAPDADHFEPITPSSPHWTAVRDAVDFLTGRSSSG